MFRKFTKDFFLALVWPAAAIVELFCRIGGCEETTPDEEVWIYEEV